MEHIKIKDPEGNVHSSQFCQFEINEKQQVLVVGCGFALDESYEVSSVDYVTVTRMGNLRGLGIIYGNQVINSVNLEKWDWSACWDPQIILLEDTRSYSEIREARDRMKNLLF